MALQIEFHARPITICSSNTSVYNDGQEIGFRVRTNGPDLLDKTGTLGRESARIRRTCCPLGVGVQILLSACAGNLKLEVSIQLLILGPGPWPSGKASPLHGEDRRFESGRVHFFDS
jgi:hypothetical protein